MQIVCVSVIVQIDEEKMIYIDTACMPDVKFSWHKIKSKIYGLSETLIIHGMELLCSDAITLIRLLFWPHFVHYIIQVMSVID